MAKFLDKIPLEFQPGENDFVKYVEAIRGVKNKNMEDINNFQPTCIERKNSFFQSNDPSIYSVSLFDSVENLIHAIEPFPKTKAKLVGVAIGQTFIDRGISLEKDADGHINYFLYDWEHNNPAQFRDFSYLRDL